MDQPIPAEASKPEAVPPPAWLGDRNLFLSRLVVATCSVILLLGSFYLLRELKTILQPLFIAIFICYLILPVHRWLAAHGVPPILGYVLIMILILGTLFGLGTLVYLNVEKVIERSAEYEQHLRTNLKNLAELFGVEANLDRPLLELSQVDWMAIAGPFRDFLGSLAITFIYLVFLIAEKVSFTHRVELAFSAEHGKQVLGVVDNINDAIAEYISIKTFISFVAGMLSIVVLAYFKVSFAVTWGILIFLFNFIPYIGSLVAVGLPIALSFLELEPGPAIVVTLLLLAIQQMCGIMEPRMAGQKLGVSPLLILLSLAFWGLVWGIVGMILAVPLLMVLKIVLENIPETKALATLMSNR